MASRRMLLAAPRDRLPDLDELIKAWRAADIRVHTVPFGADLPDMQALVANGDCFDAALLIGPPRRAPATAVRAPFAIDRRGRRVPLSWLPATSSAALRRFAAGAARVHRRGQQQKSVVLLGQWHPQYLRLADRIEALLKGRQELLRWTGEVIIRNELVKALGAGLGLGIYVGHGRPNGWVGYHGMRAHHFEHFAGEPLGGLLSLCCRTASRRHTGLSYAEALPLAGVAAATLGAVSDTRHTDNTRWAVRICEALKTGVQSVGELIAVSAPENASASAAYRIMGDPLAPLTAERRALRRARAVPTYP